MKRKTVMKYKNYILAALSALTIVSCSEGFLEKEGMHISLTVSTDPATVTKAAPDGDDALNENLIQSVYYFFYPEGSANSAPVLSGSYSGLSLTGSSPDWDIPVSTDQVNLLFPAGHNNCRLFIVANPPSSILGDLRGNPSYSSLHGLSFQGSLDGVQDNFVMTYDGLVEVISRSKNKVATANVGLKRVANKLTIKAIINKSFEDGTSVLQSAALKAGFVNGMNLANLGGDFSAFSESDAESNRFESSWHTFTSLVSDGDKWKATIEIPFYTYPMQWDFEDVSEPYIFFELPLSNGENRYYRFMLSDKEITANKWYDLTIYLNKSGSMYKDDPTQQYVRQTYQVLDWVNAWEVDKNGGNNVNADIKEARYLVLNKTDFEIYDQETLSIPFVTSHPVEIGNIVVRKKNFKNGGYTNMSSTDAEKLLFNEGTVIEFEHALNNDIYDANLDCVPWEISFDIYHTGTDPETSHAWKETFIEHVTITQYPSIYIETEANNGSRNKGNVYVYGSNAAVGGQFGGVSGLSGTDNDMTIIHIGRIDSKEYMIVDPRKADYDNLSLTNKYTSLYSGNNQALKYYRPTIEPENSQDLSRTFIAPVIRTASGYGQLSVISGGVTYANAKKRCASYQEDGYPAGRWRLPTEAEVKFMITLSGTFIPAMFNNGTQYWYAGGYITANDGNAATYQLGGSGNKYVRCVYDEWYWSKVPEQYRRQNTKTTFTWGDMPRNY